MDALLLQKVIDFFIRWQAENAQRVRIHPSKHGAVIAVLYKAAAVRGKAEDAELEQILSIAA